MGQDVVPYAYGCPIWIYVYGTSHTCMGQYTHIGQNNIKINSEEGLQFPFQ